MRKSVVWIVFGVLVAGGLWLSTFETGESREPRVYSEKRERAERTSPASPSPRAAEGDGIRERRAPAVVAPPSSRDEPSWVEGAERDAPSRAPAELAAATFVPSPVEVERVRLETVAAEFTSSHGLIRALDLEHRIEQAVPAGSLPPEELEVAREDARRRILADTAIVEHLALRKVGPDAPASELQRARDMAMTLLTMQDSSYRDRMLTEVVAETE